MTDNAHILVTGGAGYIGSLLTSELLRTGYRVTVVDSLLYGGESLLAFLAHPGFRFERADVTEPGAIRAALPREWPRPEAVIHLAAIVGFPACQALGRQAAWRYNVDAVKRVFELAGSAGCGRFIFTSTYSGYASSPEGSPLNEASPLTPQSIYAETKIAAEEYLAAQKGTLPAVTTFRLPSLFGISPRTRFDLLVNQFVLDAFTRRELIIYQRSYSRSFVHVRDVVRGLIMGLEAPADKAGGQVFNLGSEAGNHTKEEIVALVLKRLPDTMVTYKDLTFGGDVRDLSVSFSKIREELGFQPTLSVDDGVREVVKALQQGMLRNPHDEKFTNARFIIQ
jgi:nucleoside-diphosphate-sugar epimerase